MKFNPFLFFLILISVIISTAILVQSYYAGNINKLYAEKKSYENQLLQNIKLPQVNLGDLFLFAQKNKTVNQSTQGKMYFSAKSSKINANERLIEIKLEGNSNSLTDAADLLLEFPTNIEVTEIISGDAFPLYPRKIINQQSTLITGLASINKNSVNFGRPGNIFTNLKIKINQAESTTPILKVNTKETKIFFYGENILDENRNISQIELQ